MSLQEGVHDIGVHSGLGIPVLHLLVLTVINRSRGRRGSHSCGQCEAPLELVFHFPTTLPCMAVQAQELIGVSMTGIVHTQGIRIRARDDGVVALILRFVPQAIGVEQQLRFVGSPRESAEEGQAVGPFDVALVLISPSASSSSSSAAHHVLDSGALGVRKQEHLCLIFGLWEANSCRVMEIG